MGQMYNLHQRNTHENQEIWNVLFTSIDAYFHTLSNSYGIMQTEHRPPSDNIARFFISTQKCIM